MNVRVCLDSEETPKPGASCEFCKYREFAGKKLLELHQASKTEKTSDADKKKVKK